MKLEIKRLVRDYGTKRVLDLEEVTIEKGTRTAIIGPNGAGKSTLLNIVSRIDSASEGEVVYESEDPRLVTQVLGEKNFNQMINRHRIEDACRRLADAAATTSVLEISGEVGFASLGPFNRAFKAATGCTPTAYRAVCRMKAVADAGEGGADPALSPSLR